MAITLRGVKGSALTQAELDANFTTLRDTASQTGGSISGLTSLTMSGAIDFVNAAYQTAHAGANRVAYFTDANNILLSGTTDWSVHNQADNVVLLKVLNTGALTTMDQTINGALSTSNLTINCSHASSPFGAIINYTAAAPGGTSNYFLRCLDTGGEKANIRGNGGFANFQANDVNLSDPITKRTFVAYDDALLDKLADAMDRVDFGRYKTHDQTHDDWNHGPSATGVESAFSAVAPELVAAEWNLGPYFKAKNIYTHDLSNIAMAALAHRNRQLQRRVEAIEQHLGIKQ